MDRAEGLGRYRRGEGPLVAEQISAVEDMYEGNVNKILSMIRPDDIVLDVGGWAQPFRRANYVLDIFPYETRGWYQHLGMPPSLGEGPEYFTRETWIQRDICDKEPWPFADKSIDFVICSHTLEDVRDPLWVCSEIIRVGKRGYIEVPSLYAEFLPSRNTRLAGAPHHRWLITIKNNKILFEMKYHLIHRPDLHLPPYLGLLLKPEDMVQWMFWEESFDFQEASVPLGEEDIEKRLREYVQSLTPPLSVLNKLLLIFIFELRHYLRKVPWPTPLLGTLRTLYRRMSALTFQKVRKAP